MHSTRKLQRRSLLVLPCLIAFLHALAGVNASVWISSGGPCEYWGVGLCTYDGTHRRPERCTGQGRRYCDRAPEATVCPPACQPGSCMRNQPARFQFHPNHFSFDWDDLVLGGHYDMVFTKADKVCVQTCWKDPWKMKCAASRMYSGRHYCVDINCEHDETNRFAGCHHDDAWHAPTCSECARLFPTACGPILQGYGNKNTPDWEYLEIQNWENPSERIEAQEAEAAAKRAQWLIALSAYSSRDDGDDDGEESSDKRGAGKSDADKSDASSAETSEESSAELSSDDKKKNRDSEDRDDFDNKEKRKSDGNSSDAKDDDGGCDDSWIDYWKSLLRSSRSFDCVSANSRLQGTNENRVNNFTRIPSVEAANLPGVTSFNEITFQVAGNSASVDASQTIKTFSRLSGVPSKFVQLVDTEETLPYEGSFASNDTHSDETITTVTVVIWSDDPYAVDTLLLRQLADMTDIMQNEAGMGGYLEASMSVNVVVAPDVGLEQSANVNPLAISNFSASDSASRSSAGDVSDRTLVVIAAASGSLVAGVLAVTLVVRARFGRRTSRDSEAPNTVHEADDATSRSTDAARLATSGIDDKTTV